MSRSKPNIIITGTPGVGKTTLCESLGEKKNMQHLSVNQIVKDKACHEGWSEEHQSWIVDEDKLLDAIEEDVKQGGYLIDWHACDPFPESWIDLVVVLRADSTTLFDRLQSRHYSEAKLQENIDAEIMEVILQEAREAFNERIVIELSSNSSEEMEMNQARIEEWIKQWVANNGAT